MNRHLTTLLVSCLVFFLVGSALSLAQTGWVVRTRGIPQGIHFNAVTMFDPITGVAVGTNGTIVQTHDAGWTWGVRTAGTSGTLYDIDDDIAVGANGLILVGWTNGTTWEKWGLAPSVNSTLHCVDKQSFSSGYHILIAGDDGIVMRSSDGGHDWRVDTLPVSTSGSRPTLRACTNISSSSAVVVGDGGVIFYLDSLSRWTPASSGTTENLTAVSAPTIVHPDMVALGDGGAVISGSENGASWKRVSAFSDVQLRDITFVNHSIAYAVGENGHILKSTDNGLSWFEQDSHTTASLQSVAIDGNEMNGFAVGANGTVLSTFNGGMQTVAPANWIQLNAVPFGRSLRAVQCLTDSIFIAVGDFATIVRTTDRGNTWQPISSKISGNLQGVAFSSPARGFIVSSSGEMYWSKDSGNTWKEVPVQRYGDYRAITCVDAKTFYAVTRDHIVRSIDSGKTWQIVSNSIPLDKAEYSGVSFIDTLRGTAVSWNGSVVTTTNGGDTWTVDHHDSLGTGGDGTFSSVSLNASGFGVIASRRGVIMKTNDGLTWTLTTRVERTFDCASVTNTGTASVGGWETALGTTTDFGATWQFAAPDPVNPLNVQIHGLHHLTDDTRVAVGDYGMILMWNENAPSSVPEVSHADVQVNIFPNPTPGLATIRCVGGGFGTWYVDIVDASGSSMYPLLSNEVLSETYTTVIDTRVLPAGLYWCRVTKDGYVLSHPLTVVR